ncbi:hypothetical protein [Kineococcus sp. SYSU DK005]|uniref:hypothetical protein n=1 Tax=Kineococcus sp. SYSU DK005 TaxID=3383126 RepID=UPI003D7EE105
MIDASSTPHPRRRHVGAVVIAAFRGMLGIAAAAALRTPIEDVLPGAARRRRVIVDLAAAESVDAHALGSW